ncbi:diguanylate cyclase [bacterium]|nr:diguanylate cyclase [bacterium]
MSDLSPETLYQLQIFEAMGRALAGSLKLDELLDRIVKLVAEHLGYKHTAILLYHKAEGQIEVAACNSKLYNKALRTCYPDNRGIIGEVVRTARTIIVSDTGQDPRYFSGSRFDNIGRSEIAVPIIVEGQVVGILDCESESLSSFDHIDERLLSSLTPGIGMAIRNTRNFTRLSQRASELESILEVSELLTSTTTLDTVFQRVLFHACRLTRSGSGSISLYDKKTNQMQLKAVRGFHDQGELNATWPLRDGGIAWRVRAGRQPLVVNDIHQDVPGTGHAVEKARIRAFIAVPLYSASRFNGVLFVDEQKPRQYTNDDVRVLSILSNSASIAIDNASRGEQLSEMAYTDSLTGLANRRSFMEMLEREANRARRYSRPFSVVMLDIDHFKVYNDTFGHPAGDLALRVTARVIRETIRDTDYPARYGGEEFILLLPEVDADEALHLAERIRVALEAQPWGEGKELKRQLTISGGITTLPTDTNDSEDLIHLADEALYHSKRQGRNRISEYRELVGKWKL